MRARGTQTRPRGSSPETRCRLTAPFLAMASEDPNATLPYLLQVNGMRLDEPELGEPVVENKGQRVFFTTTARDFSGSCKVAVSQVAALALSGLESMSEFQQAH